MTRRPPDTPTAALRAFDEIVELSAADRRDRLAALAVDDPALHGEVTRLLDADSQADFMLTRFDAILGAHDDRDPLRLIGSTVSHYRIVGTLARGGMGVVYRAEDMKLGRGVALKFPLSERLVDAVARQRFQREARMAAALDHPNLYTVYEIGETADGELFYTMPLYEGETLRERLSRSGALPLDAVIDIGSQLARGLAAAHRVGIVHRDLKPANVMLLADGTAKILDFGLARTSDHGLTATTDRLGTVSYMAPEQLRGDTVDQRADLWSLGVIMFEMATGRRPFTGGHELAVVHSVLNDDIRRASTLRSDIPGELDDAIRVLMERDIDARCDSAVDLGARLTALDSSRPHVQPSTSSTPQWRAPAVRRRTVAIATAATLVILVAAVALARAMSAGAPAIAVAVIPFQAVGDSASSQHLAIGLSESLGADLSRLRRVAARDYLTMALYRGDTIPMERIAAEQQVDAVLRGTVQRAGDQVRVQASLIRTPSGRVLWNRNFTRPASELAHLERDVLRATIASLSVRTDRQEREFMERPAARNGPAYELYLRGRAIEVTAEASSVFIVPLSAETVRQAASLFSQARQVDPDFALARARLALMHANAALFDTTLARREQVRIEAESALRLAPDLTEAVIALARYHAGRGDGSSAVETLRKALDRDPADARLRLELAEQLEFAGRREEAAVEHDRLMTWEPGNHRVFLAAALNYSRLRRRAEAMPLFDRASSLAPREYQIRIIKGHSFVRWKGIPDTLEAAMRAVPSEYDEDGMATYARFTALWAGRRYADAIQMLDASASVLSRDALTFEPTALMRARVYDSMGQRQLARASYAEARSLLRDSVAANPTNPQMRMALGVALAGLEQRADAVREARRALDSAPPGATSVMAGAVEVYARSGEIDAAIELLELLFTMSAGREVTVAFLRVWPAFDGLRGDPRFEDLLQRFNDAA